MICSWLISMVSKPINSVLFFVAIFSQRGEIAAPKWLSLWNHEFVLSNVVFHEWLSSPKIVFHQRMSSIRISPPSKVIFHQMLSSIKCHPPSSVVFHQRLSSIEGCVPSNQGSNEMWSSIKGCRPSKMVFHQRSHLSSKVVFIYNLIN